MFWCMDDMWQKSINTYESLHMTKSQPNLTHVANVAKNQPSLIRLAKSQPR
jgi:hypothetical protein